MIPPGRRRHLFFLYARSALHPFVILDDLGGRRRGIVGKAQVLAQLGFDLVADVGMFLQKGPHIVAALAQALGAEGEPGPGLVDDIGLHAHGHLDHTWGLPYLLALFAEHATEGRPLPRPRLVAHPEALTPRFFEGQPIGSLLSQDILADHCDLTLTREPLALTDRLVFLGEIPRRPDLVTPGPVGERRTPDGLVPDTLPDDTALVYRGTDGLVILTGCSHAGIANIVERARDVTGEDRLTAIIGGLHLRGPAPEGLDATVDALAGTGVTALYPCHCTSLAAKIALNRAAPVFEVGVGSRFVWD